MRELNLHVSKINELLNFWNRIIVDDKSTTIHLLPIRNLVSALIDIKCTKKDRN